ncbi:hypothetical protein I309_06636 [Cryptococcus deuterogattii LA55]|nr:hypothetical protein I309_06643 [Cryptococcus deuterogattii LA55]KIR24542.1 hypothetical protein I309_06636 [Cryptococcus deuterogattii LA55]
MKFKTLASTTPVSPPIVNRATNPSPNSIGAVYRIDPPYAVAPTLYSIISDLG